MLTFWLEIAVTMIFDNNLCSLRSVWVTSKPLGWQSACKFVPNKNATDQSWLKTGPEVTFLHEFDVFCLFFATFCRKGPFLKTFGGQYSTKFHTKVTLSGSRVAVDNDVEKSEHFFHVSVGFMLTLSVKTCAANIFEVPNSCVYHFWTY